MKLEIRLEIWGDDVTRPILFFVDELDSRKLLKAYNERLGHMQTSRAYMRRCKKPETPVDFARCWAFLESYAYTVKSRI